MRKDLKNEMARSVHIRRIVALSICCILVFRSAVPVAHAVEPVSASLSIAAGAVALGGLSAAAVESTIGPQVAAIVGTTMQGLGTSTYTAEDSALTKTGFIMSKIAVWCVQAKIAKEEFYKRVAEGVTVAANGTIQLSHDASKLISQFISWVFTQGTDTVVPELPSGESSVQLGDFNFPLVSSYTPDSSLSNRSLEVIGGSAVAICQIWTGRRWDIYAISNQDVYIKILENGTPLSGSTHIAQPMSTNVSSIVYGGPVGVFTAKSGGFGLPSFASLSEFNTFRNSIDGTWNPSESVPAQDVFVGSKADWEENKDVLNPAIDNVTTLTPDLINKLIDQLAEGKVATMDIATYLDSLVDAFDGLKSQVAEITDTLTGIQESIAVPDSLTTVVTNEETDPESDPGYEPEKVDPPKVVESMRYPLKDYFPFCIPFDLYALFQIFNADPVAPAFTIDYTFPVGNGIPIHIDVDLSDWDSLASTVRFLEVVSFIVGLAVATRRLFIRV